MKKIFLITILLAPLFVGAAPTNFEASWTTYPFPTAVMTVSCGVNGATKASVGSAAASVGKLGFSLAANPGDTIACTAQAALSGDSSPPSSEAATKLPLVLPAPTLNVRAVP